MKAEEALIRAASTSEVEDKRQDSLIGAANGTAARLLDGKNDAHPHATSASNSSNGGIAINGNVNEKGPREDENTSDLTKENDRKTSDINDGREQLANEELGKVN